MLTASLSLSSNPLLASVAPTFTPTPQSVVLLSRWGHRRPPIPHSHFVSCLVYPLNFAAVKPRLPFPGCSADDDAPTLPPPCYLFMRARELDQLSLSSYDSRKKKEANSYGLSIKSTTKRKSDGTIDVPYIYICACARVITYIL